jgi:hypothetical protein
VVDQQSHSHRARAIAVTPADVRALFKVLEVLSGEVETMVDLASEDRQLGWWRQYAEVLRSEGHLSMEFRSGGAASLRSEVVPGLPEPRNTQPKLSGTRLADRYPRKHRFR